MVHEQQYANQFAEVHRKVRIFKDLLREANKHDAELRESRQIPEADETIEGECAHLKGSQ